jgi:hypothetical protein
MPITRSIGIGLCAWLASAVVAQAKPPTVEFDMTPSAGALTCAANATAHVKVTSKGSVETMDVKASGLPGKTGFGVFVIQVPKAPFGLSWYEGDLTTNSRGKGHAKFVGRFSSETFAVAPGTAPAPVVHAGPFPDAALNPAFNPMHTFHVGIWFDSPDGASAAGCPATVTPFNGTHGAGIQVLNTAGYADDQGPLRQLNP